jgi:predicted Zn-dependent protease
MPMCLFTGPRTTLVVASILLAWFGLSSCAATNIPTLTDAPYAPGQALELDDDEEELWHTASRIENSIACDACGDLLYRYDPLDDYLQAVADRLLDRFTGRPGLEVRVRAIKNPSRNAFVLPNGATYVSTGLFIGMDNEDQLAAVLGHELSHFLGRHSLRNKRHTENKRRWSTAFSILAAGAGIDAGTLWSISSIGGYSRELELEADTLGLQLMTNAGYDPREAPLIFEKLLAAADEDDAAELQVYASHPKLQDRLANYRMLVANTESPTRLESIRAPADYSHLVDLVYLDNVELEIHGQMREQARESLGRFIERHPTSARAYFLLGEAVSGVADSDQAAALDFYKTAITLADAPAEAFKAAALIHRSRGEHASAAEYFLRYLTARPLAVDAPIIRGYLEDATERDGGLSANRDDRKDTEIIAPVGD